MTEDNPKVVDRNSWKIFPMPKWKSRLSIKRSFTQNEFENLAKGILPETMDDKWFVFFENDWLYFHRSWTGICVYQVKLAKDKNQYHVTEAWVNRNFKQYKSIFKFFDKFLLNLFIKYLSRGNKI